MINDTEIKQILQKDIIQVQDIIQVLIRYIYDRKKIEVNLDPFFIQLNNQEFLFFYRKHYMLLSNHVLNFYTIKLNLKEYLLFNP
jgi:hypothetical protein